MESTDKQISHSIQCNAVNIANDVPQKAHCNGVDSDSDTVYYGVHIPSDIQVQDTDGYSNVYQDKLEALKLVKKYKKARFKAFNFYHEAVEFAVHGSEFPNNTTIGKALCVSTEGSAPVKESAQPTVGEKPPPFRGPKSQDLVKLRKGIEAGNLDVVQTTIWENPRYLISSGDTPSILQEGSRYNALHVAAKAKNREMCELILNTISNTSFIKLLYGDDNNQDSNERAKILLDLYLNTPDKGLNETPLHFAVKFGAVEVVELLVSFPQCDKTLTNKYGKSVSMMICDRCESSPAAVKNKIAMLLDETFYVPVLRSEDNCTPPVIGEPFAPTSPPNFNTNFLNPRLEIHAYAGPMSKEGADKFRKVWKTPPRSLLLGSSSRRVLKVNPINNAAALKFKDLEKGLERLGRNLAAEFDVGWKEYWSFLGSFVDLSSPEGLWQLENYLADRFNSEYSCSSSPKYTSSSESELISSSPKMRSKEVEQESILSPMSDLCKNMEACSLTDGDVKRRNNHVKPNFNNTSPISTDNVHDLVSETQLFKPELNPFLCVEKSCQVFAHRISNDILQLLESEYGNTTGHLEMQVKQLELLMASFMDDSRFISVDFHLVHYRLGCLISTKLKDVLIQDDEFNFMRNSLEHWLDSSSRQFDYFSSDDESGNYRQAAHVLKRSTSKHKQVVCLLECILRSLVIDMKGVSTGGIKDEEVCMRVWGEAKPCACVWQTQMMRRSSLVKKTNSFKYTSRGLATSLRNEKDNVSRQLSYEDSERVSNNLENHCDLLITKSASAVSQSIDNSQGRAPNERYYTPPSSPSFLDDDSSDDDVFEDSFLPEHDIFIEGNEPTKTDYAVYNAVKCAEDRLNPKDYPHVYKWCHTVSLYPESEQRSWLSPSIGRYTIGSPSTTSTPPRGSFNRLNSHTPSRYTPPNSWLRITGANSPRDSLKCHARASLSFNL